MCLLPNKHLIFVKRRKTGGTSIRLFLLQFGNENTNGGKLVAHSSLKDYKNYLKNKFDSHFKFTVTRNPYDRFVSLYLDFINKNKNRPENYDSPEAFKLWLKTYYFKDDHEMFCIKGVPACNYYIRFTCLKDDLNLLLKNLNNNGWSLKYRGQPLSHVNQNKIKSRKRTYTFFYDEESKSIVLEKAKKEIEFFQYTFSQIEPKINYNKTIGYDWQT